VVVAVVVVVVVVAVVVVAVVKVAVALVEVVVVEVDERLTVVNVRVDVAVSVDVAEVAVTVVLTDVAAVSVVLEAATVVETQLNSRWYASKVGSGETGGATVNRRQAPFSRNVKNVQPKLDEHSTAHPLASLVVCKSMSALLFACRVPWLKTYPSTPSGHVFSVAVLVAAADVDVVVAVMVGAICKHSTVARMAARLRTVRVL
jgi:hypothetical protein